MSDDRIVADLVAAVRTELKPFLETLDGLATSLRDMVAAQQAARPSEAIMRNLIELLDTTHERTASFHGTTAVDEIRELRDDLDRARLKLMLLETRVKTLEHHCNIANRSGDPTDEEAQHDPDR